jgi:hypothetical protein
MAIGRGRIWFPDGRVYIVPLLEHPKHGVELHALGVRPHAWVVTDMRPNGNGDLLYDVWVEAAHRSLAM